MGADMAGGIMRGVVDVTRHAEQARGKDERQGH